MCHGLPDFASRLPQRGGSNTKSRDHDTLESHNKISQSLIYINLLCEREHIHKMVMQWPLVKGPVTYVYTLHLKAHDHRYFPSMAFG